MGENFQKAKRSVVNEGERDANILIIEKLKNVSIHIKQVAKFLYFFFQIYFLYYISDLYTYVYLRYL